jgi:hypothetical protein
MIPEFHAAFDMKSMLKHDYMCKRISEKEKTVSAWETGVVDNSMPHHRKRFKC